MRNVNRQFLNKGDKQMSSEGNFEDFFDFDKPPEKPVMDDENPYLMEKDKGIELISRLMPIKNLMKKEV